MFWRFGGYANISTLDSILDKPDVTTEELLDESDLIQELKQQNSKLIEFLRDEPVLKKLLNYVVADKLPGDAPSLKSPPASPKAEEKEERYSFFGKGKARSRDKSTSKKDADGDSEQEKKEAQRKKYAYVSCEVLSSEVWSITEALLEQQEHLRHFWQYMRRPAPLDPLQAGYFTKVNEALLDKKTEEMLAFFKSLDGIVPAMLQHVDCPMIMDLLLKIISLEKHEGGAGIVDWLQQQNLIPLLLGYLSPEHNSATQTSAGDFLKAIITISANATSQDQSVIGPNELTRQLVSEKCVATLIEDMLRGGNPLTVGVGIIIEVIRKNNSDYDLDNQIGPEPKTCDPIYLGTLLRQFANHIPDFMHLIRSSSAKKPDLKAAFGSKIEPLGFDRFKTCELMAELLHCSNMGLLNERGAEDEVRKRDADRERLKAEGKLGTPKAPATPSQENSHDEFGSSVDSHGFHHAERPSDDEMDEKAEDDGRKGGVLSGSDEDGFEEVKKPSTEDLPDEVTFDDLDEKVEEEEAPSNNVIVLSPEQQSPEPAAVTKPASPVKQTTLYFDPPPTQAADSPTTAGLTDQIDKLGVDEDVVMTETGTSQSEGLETEFSQHPEDKPAPLFARKDATAAAEPTSKTDQSEEQPEDIDQSIATIQGESATLSNGERPPYDTEADGSPVVGDLLKIQFVEHQVVPTILDFFFRFPWNNFLHNVVYDVVQQVFNGTLERGYNRTLAFDLFSAVEAKESQENDGLGLASTKDITDRILDGQQASDLSQKDKGMRLGYMGHLTLIAEEVCKFGNRQPAESLDQLVLDRVNREEWTQYVEGPLAETRDKDNAVLGGVRPQDSMGVRAMSIGGLGGGGGGGGFTANSASALASAGIGSGGIVPQDSLAMVGEGVTTGQGFEINSGGMLAAFGDGGEDDDEEMDEETERRLMGVGMVGGRESAFTEDEQTSPDSKTGIPSIPPPLNIPPSRARRQLARRLAAKQAVAVENADPDAADHAALETANALTEDPEDNPIDLSSVEDGGLQITGLRTVRMSGGSASRFSGLFSGSDDSSSEDDEMMGFDEDDAGKDETVARAEGDFEDDDDGDYSSDLSQRWAARRDSRDRRPSTTEAKERTPLDDDEDEDAADLGRAFDAKLAVGAEGPFADPADVNDNSSDEDELVEIRTRRTS